MKIFNCIFLFLFLLSQGLIAQTLVSENVLTNAPLYYNHTPNIARTSDGVLGVVWNSPEGQVVYSEYDETFGIWSPAVAISSAGDQATKAGIVGDDDGNLYVAWQQRETSDQDYAIYFTKKAGGVWSTPVNLTGNDAENEECGIAVSDNGAIFVAWNTDAEADTAEFVYCITSADGGSTWSEPAVLSSEDGIIGGSSTTSGRPYLVKATGGKMVCTWHEEPDDHPDRESFINQYDGSNWLGETVYINTSDSANTMYPAVIVDSKDNIYMTTVSFTSTERLLLLTKGWDDPIWTDGDEKVLFEDPQVTKPVMAIDKNDNIYLGFRRDNAADTTGIEEVAYMTSYNNGQTWSDIISLSRENYDAGYLSLDPNVSDNGVDFLWRESATEGIDDGDTTTIVSATEELITIPAIDDQTIVSENLLTNAPLYYNHTPNIARTSDGVLGVVWNSPEGQVVYSEYDETFGIWSPSVAISSAGDQATKAGIVGDDDGNLYVAWQQRETSDQDYAIYFTKKAGGVWSTPVNLTGNDAENEECGIAVSDNGTIFVAWNTDAEADTAEFVYCITSADGSTWSEPAKLSSEDGIIGGSSTTSGRPYLAKATNGKMVCVWHEEPDDHPDRESFINQYDGSNWLGEMVYINTSDSANTMYPSVTVDSEDNIYMTTVSFTSTERLLLLTKGWDDPIWTDGDEKVLFEDPSLTKPVMAIDDNDDIYLGFRRANPKGSGLEEAAYMTSEDKGETWSDQTRLSRDGYDAGYLSVGLNVGETGVDFLWRESATEGIDDGDTTTILHANISLLKTSIEYNNENIVTDYKLSQNYPNPFNPSTVINFSLPKSSLVTLKIFNILGEEVAELINDVKAAGNYKVSFNASNLASGMYIYQIQAEKFSAAKKMMLIK